MKNFDKIVACKYHNSMKVKLTLITWILFMSCRISYSQIAKNTDTTQIYSAVLNSIDSHKKIIYVSNRTDATDLKQFNFKHIEYYILGTKRFDLYKDSLWKSFLNVIDTSKLNKKYVLNTSLSHNEVYVIPNNLIDFKKQLQANSSVYGILFFSPVIISNDQKKAIFINRRISSSEDVSKTIFFLSYFNNVWNIVKSILLEIS